LKIAQKCHRKFVTVQAGEGTPFIDEILSTLPQIIGDLEPQQIHTFYEAIGFMIQAQTDTKIAEVLVARLMELPNNTWSRIMADSARNVEYLRQQETAKSIANILRYKISDIFVIPSLIIAKEPMCVLRLRLVGTIYRNSTKYSSTRLMFTRYLLTMNTSGCLLKLHM